MVRALWQAGCGLYVASMFALGWGEIEHAGSLFRSESWTEALLAVRLVAGAAMAAASIRWWQVMQGCANHALADG